MREGREGKGTLLTYVCRNAAGLVQEQTAMSRDKAIEDDVVRYGVEWRGGVWFLRRLTDHR